MEELRRLLTKIGVSEADMAKALDNMKSWSKQVRMIESDNNPMAMPENTTAKGVYQFVDASVPVGKQRMRNVGFPEELIGSIKENPQQWTDEQADNIFFGNVFAQTGSDPVLREIAMGNQMARRQAYYKFHHTDPDEATMLRTEKFIPVSNQPVDDLFTNYTKSKL